VKKFAWFAVVLTLAGCGSFSERTKDSSNLYVVATRYDVKTLDPAAVQDWTTGYVLSYLYRSIGEVCSIETRDFVTFHLTLSPFNFGDGKPARAEDIEFTLDRVLDPETNSGTGFQFASQIKSKRVIDSNKLELVLKAPDAAFKEKLSNRVFGVVQKAKVKRNQLLTDFQVGFGISRWKMVDHIPNEMITLEHLENKERVRFRYVRDSSTRRNLFDTGQVQYAMFAPHEKGALNGVSGIKTGGPETLVYLQINSKTAPFLNLETRNALAETVYKNVDFKKLLGGVVEPTSSIAALSFKKEKFTATGRIEKVIRTPIQITYAEIGMQNPVVEGIIAGLNKAGFNSTGRAMPSGEMLAKNQKGEIPLLFTGWQPDFEGSLNTVPMLFHSKSSENHSGFSNRLVDELIEKAQRGESTDQNIRVALSQIESFRPIITLYVQKDMVLITKPLPKPY
jgi:ABC-type oligopeptide transport system substrate-binding subunit